MRKYETPELKSIYFELNNRIMDGYEGGDIGDNPWGELFTEEGSGDDPLQPSAFCTWFFVI